MSKWGFIVTCRGKPVFCLPAQKSEARINAVVCPGLQSRGVTSHSPLLALHPVGKEGTLLPSAIPKCWGFPNCNGRLLWQDCKSCYCKWTKCLEAVKMSVKWRAFLHNPAPFLPPRNQLLVWTNACTGLLVFSPPRGRALCSLFSSWSIQRIHNITSHGLKTSTQRDIKNKSSCSFGPCATHLLADFCIRKVHQT